MTITLLIIGWFACGLLGGFLMYVDWRWSFQQSGNPRPLDILVWIFLSPFGVAMLGMAIFIHIVSWFQRQSKREDTWWTRPIGQPKDFYKDAWWKKRT